MLYGFAIVAGIVFCSIGLGIVLGNAIAVMGE